MSLALNDLPRDPDRLLSMLQQMDEVIFQQNDALVSLRAEYDTVLAERDTAQVEIEKLRLLIRQLQRGQFGRRSERLDPDQLQLGLEDLEQTAAAAEAAQEAAPRSSDTSRLARPRRRYLGAVPAHLPRVEVLVDIEDKTCPCCGGSLHAIGEDTSEMLDIVPAQLQVKVIRRPRYACRACEEAVVQAPAPERPITGGMATEALLAHVLVAKFSGRSYASIDTSSSILLLPPKRAKSAMEASTMRRALETTIERRRKRASQCRWRAWSRSMPWVSSLPT